MSCSSTLRLSLTTAAAILGVYGVPDETILNARQPAPARGAAPSVVAFENVSVVPMDRERVLEKQTVLVRGDRIAEIGPTGKLNIPADAARVDGSGRFLMPGLGEMHAHIPGGTVPDEAIERVLFLYAANGITSIRGMLGHPRHLEWRARVARGEVFSPGIVTSGPSFNGNSVPTAADAVKMVDEQKAAGYDFLKIHPGVKRDVFDAMAARADKSGIRFAGHVPADVGLARALEARYWSIDHVDGYVEALTRNDAPVKPADSVWFGVNLAAHADTSRIPSLVEQTRHAGTWIVPTETLFDNTVGPTDPDEMARWPEMAWAPPGQVTQWIEQNRKLAAGNDAATRAKFLEIRRRLIKSLHDGGAGIALGSDAPQIWNVPGFSIHRELQAMVASGLTPYQALAAGTMNVARFLGTTETAGTVQAGKRADLVLVAGNPLQDIRQTAKIEGVMIGGRWMTKTELDARLTKYRS